MSERKILLDIAIGIFNKSTYWASGVLWEENEIEPFLSACENLIKKADIIAIHLSHNYSGEPVDTKYLTELTVKNILNIKEKYIKLCVDSNSLKFAGELHLRFSMDIPCSLSYTTRSHHVAVI